MDLLTVADIAKALNLPESTVRYYRDRFSAFVPVVGEGRSRRYPPEALDVLRYAAELLRSGMPADTVEQNLARRFPINAAAEPQQQQDAATQSPPLISPQEQARAMLVAVMQTEMAPYLAALQAEVAALRQQVAELTETLHEQQAHRLDAPAPALLEPVAEVETPTEPEPEPMTEPEPDAAPAPPPPRGLAENVRAWWARNFGA